MNEADIRHTLGSGEWEHFVSRPFSLFVVSLWHECYAKYIPLITDGTLSINDGVFIQGKDGMVRSYRKTKEMEALKSCLIDMLTKDRDRIKKLLEDAFYWNKVAKMECDERHIDLGQSIELVCKVTVLCAVLPRFLSESMVERDLIDNDILDQCIELKKVSLYPKLLEEVVLPLARRQVKSHGYECPAELMSIKELLEEDAVSDLELKRRVGSKRFIYLANDGKKDLIWTDDPDSFIRMIDDSECVDENGFLKGQPVFPGKVIGKAYVHTSVGDMHPSRPDTGYILVTTDSNPHIRNVIEGSCGMVVEEGKIHSSTADDFSPGLLGFKKKYNVASHGHILSHELRIPCVMGVRNATNFIKTGDLIEVDANRGIVRIVK